MKDAISVSEIKTYKDVLIEINTIEKDQKKYNKRMFITLLVASFASICLIVFFPSLLRWLANNVSILKIITSNSAAAAAFIIPLISILYYFIKSDEIIDQRNRLIEKIYLGLNNSPQWNNRITKDEIHKLIIDLLNSKLSEEIDFPKKKLD